jgi:hypothetical protein
VSSAAIDLAAVGDPRDDHDLRLVVDRVHDPVVPDPDAVVVATGEPRRSGRTWLQRESVDRGPDPLS